MELTDQDIDFLGRSALLTRFNRDQLVRCAQYFGVHRFAEGQVVIWEGRAHPSMFVLASGSAVVTKVVRGEVESVLARLSPGDHFGEINLIDSRPAAATVTAETGCLVYEIAYDRIERMFREDSEVFAKLAWAMMRGLADKLRRTNEKVQEAVEWGLDAANLDPTR